MGMTKENTMVEYNNIVQFPEGGSIYLDIDAQGGYFYIDYAGPGKKFDTRYAPHALKHLQATEYQFEEKSEMEDVIRDYIHERKNKNSDK